MNNQNDKDLLEEHRPKSMINKDKMRRQVYCRLCDVTILSDSTELRCELCGNDLIVTVKSVLTGQVITGEK